MRVKLLTALFVILTLGYAHATDGVYVIEDNGGGDVDEAVTNVLALKTGKIPVQIAGACASACTVVLMLPKSQVCAWPGAQLGFHFVTDSKTGKIRLSDTRQIAEQMYPAEVSEWLLNQTPNPHNDMFWRDATVFFPPCPGQEPPRFVTKPITTPGSAEDNDDDH